MASDGRWYPPHLHPQAAAPPQPQAPPGTPWPAAYPPQPWAQGYPPYGSGFPGGPVVVAPQTNGFAVASLVLSCCGIIPYLFGLPCVLGIIFGFVALGQIKRTGGVQAGRSAAIAGIVVGFALIAIFLLVVVTFSVASHTSGS
jgi:hypothetical protein